MGGDGWHSRIESLKVLLTFDLDLDCDNSRLVSFEYSRVLLL